MGDGVIVVLFQLTLNQYPQSGKQKLNDLERGTVQILVFQDSITTIFFLKFKDRFQYNTICCNNHIKFVLGELSKIEGFTDLQEWLFLPFAGI